LKAAACELLVAGSPTPSPLPNRNPDGHQVKQAAAKYLITAAPLAGVAAVPSAPAALSGGGAGAATSSGGLILPGGSGGGAPPAPPGEAKKLII
jgi:hypothetical protein